MAAEGKVLLGIADQIINKNDDKVCGWATNKFGGLPNWTYGPPSQYPSCDLCLKILYLVSQVYCPLEGSVYHRVLYVFGCVNRACWNNEKSWKILRSQVVDVVTETETTKPEVINEFDAGDWCDDADNWGEEAENMMDDLVSDPVASNVDKDMEAIENMTEKLKIDDQCSQDSSTERLPAEENNVQAPSFTPYYINVFEEPTSSTPMLSKHDKKLLEQYQKHNDITSLDDMGNKSNGKGKGGGGEGYEKTEIKHGDKAFYKFQKRISVCPEQCLRYQRNGVPLMMTASPTTSEIIAAVKPCLHCGGKRTMELQLMPSLVSMLEGAGESFSNNKSRTKKVLEEKPDNSLHTINKNGHVGSGATDVDNQVIMEDCNVVDKSTAMNMLQERLLSDSEVIIEFGTVLGYTCSNNCWEEGQKYIEEGVFIVPDPDAKLNIS